MTPSSNSQGKEEQVESQQPEAVKKPEESGRLSKEQIEYLKTVKIKTEKSTHHFLSWSAIQFIKAPSIQFFQWIVVFLATVFILATALSFVLEMDISIFTHGDISSDIGLRDAVSQTDGLIRTIFKTDGDPVLKGEVIANMTLEGTDLELVNQTITQLNQIIDKLEPISNTHTHTDSITARDNILPPLGTFIYDSSVLQSLAQVEQNGKLYFKQVSYIQSGFKMELGPNLRRIEVLKKKIGKMHSSGSNGLLGMFIDSAEDEVGKLRTQVQTNTNGAESKLIQAAADWQHSARLAIGHLEGFLKKNQIRSPVTGSIVKILVGANTYVNSNRVIAMINPEGSRVLASVKVSSKDIGKLKTGQKIYYKVDAYPYQQYGVFQGVVESFDLVKNGGEDKNPVADFTVRGSITAPEKLPDELRSKIKLMAGMELTGMIVTERKTLNQVILEKVINR